MPATLELRPGRLPEMLLTVPGADDVLVDAADPERSNWLRYLNHA